jgi:hypothetical protein
MGKKSMRAHLNEWLDMVALDSHPIYSGKHKQEDCGTGQPSYKAKSSMPRMAGHLPGKCEALSSTSNTAKLGSGEGSNLCAYRTMFYVPFIIFSSPSLEKLMVTAE